MNNELFDIVNENNIVIGAATRGLCHGNPTLIHRTAHIFVFSSDKQSVLLQLRNKNKDIQPDKWDASAGGHLARGENYLQAARRELSEELGLAYTGNFEFLFDLKIRNSIESENTKVYAVFSNGPFEFQKSEIQKVQFWKLSELQDMIQSEKTDIFTPVLIKEMKMILQKLQADKK